MWKEREGFRDWREKAARCAKIVDGQDEGIEHIDGTKGTIVVWDRNRPQSRNIDDGENDARSNDGRSTPKG